MVVTIFATFGQVHRFISYFHELAVFIGKGERKDGIFLQSVGRVLIPM